MKSAFIGILSCAVAALLCLGTSAEDLPGTVNTVAGGGTMGDGGPAIDAIIVGAEGLAVSSSGELYVADAQAQRVRRIGTDGIITTVAGNGGFGFSGDGGPGPEATLTQIRGVAIDGSGTVYFGENGRLRKVDSSQTIHTVASFPEAAGDIALDGSGTPFVMSRGGSQGKVWRIDPQTGIRTLVAGGGNPADGVGDGGPPTAAKLNQPKSMAFDADGNLFIAQSIRVRRVDHGGDNTITGVNESISTVVGGGAKHWSEVVEGETTATEVWELTGPLTVHPIDHSLLLSDHYYIWRVDPGDSDYVNGGAGETLTIVAGSGSYGVPQEGQPARSVDLAPDVLAFSPTGDLYVRSEQAVWMIGEGDGLITRVVGDPTLSRQQAYFSGIGGPATDASLAQVRDVAIGPYGNLFLTSGFDGYVLKVDPATDTIVAVAGLGEGYGIPITGDELALEAPLGQPGGLAFDADGNLFVSDPSQWRVWRITAQPGEAIDGDEPIGTVAGNGSSGFATEGEPATQVPVTHPKGLAFDSDGNLYVASQSWNVVWKIVEGMERGVTGEDDELIERFAGTGTSGLPQEGADATATNLRNPAGIAFDSAGQLFIAQGHIWRVDEAGKIWRAAGGTDYGLGVDGVPALQAGVGAKAGIGFDDAGNLYAIADSVDTVRRISTGADNLIRGEPDEIITTIAGHYDGIRNVVAFFGDGGPATDAAFAFDTWDNGLAFDAAGNLYLADTLNYRVRRIAEAGEIDNLCPTAEAGPPQGLHAGDTACLDGGGSHDPETPSEQLGYAWTFVQKPAGSTTSLSGADTATPCFPLDVPGDYVIGLVVTDGKGCSSEQDTVLVTSGNVPPDAVAGPDQATYVDHLVLLDGTGTTDQDGDPFTYMWTLTTPDCSNTALEDATSESPWFIPDCAGMYTAVLVASDPWASSKDDSVTIRVLSVNDFVSEVVMGAFDVVTTLPPEAVTTKGNQQALTNHLENALKFHEAEDVEKTISKLTAAMERTDGCAREGRPDLGGTGAGNPPAIDYINNCADQDLVYPLLEAALDALLSG